MLTIAQNTDKPCCRSRWRLERGTRRKIYDLCHMCPSDNRVVTPIADAGPCRCNIDACDKLDPNECAVHGELHRLVCEPRS
jgi:hypothetical protein